MKRNIGMGYRITIDDFSTSGLNVQCYCVLVEPYLSVHVCQVCYKVSGDIRQYSQQSSSLTSATCN